MNAKTERPGNASLGRAMEASATTATCRCSGMSHLFESVDQAYSQAFMRNLHIHPGVCPSRAYLPRLMKVLEPGRIDASVLLTRICR